MINDRCFAMLQQMRSVNYDQRFMVLAPTVQQCDEINNFRLAVLLNDPNRYAVNIPAIDIQDWEYLERDDARRVRGGTYDLKANVLLVEGMRIMIVANHLGALSHIKNGMFGYLHRISRDGTSVFIEFDAWPGQIVEIPRFIGTDAPSGFTRIQFAISPGYAATIHKVQSQTLPGLNILMSPLFGHGLAYSAIARVPNHQNVHLLGQFDGQSLLCNDNRVYQYYEEKEIEL
ncbi:hypothetical protein MIR68_012653 [Amoeboaphelidium protococcarum]|nr:hypothetical protein MIR68_012653 [Amoeboaphelidium protococcarum]